MFERRGITWPSPVPLVDGDVPRYTAIYGDDHIIWSLSDGATVTLTFEQDGDATRFNLVATDVARPLGSLGLRFAGITGARSYLRNGYQSWDGSYFASPGTLPGDGPQAKAPTLGFAMTALLANDQAGAVLLGADRHDRFQTRLHFGGSAQALSLDIETLLDYTGIAAMETLWLFDAATVEAGLRRWSRRVAAASPLAPRLPAKRLTGWCSWYNHYAAIDETTIRHEIHAARAFRDQHGVPLDIFQIDDGFTPEMGDWLEVKPQFPRGITPLLKEVSSAGFKPGLWIAPFLVGNRSRLSTDHPDWLVVDRQAGGPLVAFAFYGEFRWHKHSEEYYVLDITHPEAAAYVTRVLRTWVQEWGVRYIKADFLLHGAEYGPDRASWHQTGMSRIAIWRRMMTLIREAVGDDVIVSGCGAPLWASIGLVDAVRIGRDMGVSWQGEYSAESLLRDLQTRNHANGILWQADPDCVLLRDRFHHLSDDEIEALARFAAGAGGVLMTSDTLDTLPPERAALFAGLLSAGATGCDFPLLGNDGVVVEQRVKCRAGLMAVNLFNPSDCPATANDGGYVAPHTLVVR